MTFDPRRHGSPVQELSTVALVEQLEEIVFTADQSVAWCGRVQSLLDELGRRQNERLATEQERQGRLIQANEVEIGDEIVVAEVADYETGEVHHGVAIEARRGASGSNPHQPDVVTIVLREVSWSTEGLVYELHPTRNVALVKRHGAGRGIR